MKGQERKLHWSPSGLQAEHKAELWISCWSPEEAFVTTECMQSDLPWFHSFLLVPILTCSMGICGFPAFILSIIQFSRHTPIFWGLRGCLKIHTLYSLTVKQGSPSVLEGWPNPLKDPEVHNESPSRYPGSKLQLWMSGWVCYFPVVLQEELRKTAFTKTPSTFITERHKQNFYPHEIFLKPDWVVTAEKKKHLTN